MKMTKNTAEQVSLNSETNLNFSASYKGFDLSFSLSGVFGHKI